MKGRIIVVTAFAVLLALGLCACGQQGGSGSEESEGASEQAAPAGEYATMADVFAVESPETMFAYDDEQFSYAFLDGENYMRVTIDLPEGMKDELDAADFDNAKIEELLGPLPIADQAVQPIPPQAELDALVGKTGADLEAEGYTFGMLVVNGDETDCGATKGAFDYLITFDGAVEDEDTDDVAGAVRDMTVKAVALQGLSFAEPGF